MPRTSKALAILLEKERALETEVQRAAAEAERIGGELRLVRELKKQFATLPKRSRAKARALAVPTSNTNTTATAA